MHGEATENLLREERREVDGRAAFLKEMWDSKLRPLHNCFRRKNFEFFGLMPD